MTGDNPKVKEYVERVRSRAAQLHNSDAFEPARRERYAVSAAEAKVIERAGRKGARKVIVGFTMACVAVIAFSLLLPYYGFDAMGVGNEVYAPSDVLSCYGLWLQLNLTPLFDPTFANRAGSVYADFAAVHPAGLYTLVINRASVTLVTIACGILLSLAGLLFQTAFRNPLAAPTTLGVSDGVTLGCIIFAWMGHTSILDDPVLYVILAYGLGAVVVLAVLVSSRVMSGGARYNVLDMLLLGTVVCQLIGGVNGFVQNFQMDTDTWFNFYEIQQATNAVSSPFVCAVVLGVFAVTFVPALVLRFRLNLVSFSDEEGTMMGVRAGLLRAGALVLGSLMELAALATIGQVAMLSLAVPFAVRYMLPADFRSQFLGNCLLGSAVLLACTAIQHFATVGVITMPVGTIVSIFVVPVFVWMVAFGKGRW